MKPLFKQGLLFSLLLSIIVIGVYAADNNNDGSKDVTHISQKELAEKMKDPNSVLIDIRRQDEVNRGYIPGATHVPITEIMKNPSLLDPYKDKDLIFYCQTGVRAGILTDFLQDNAHSSKEQLYHLKGDMRAWRAKGNKVQIDK